MMKSGFFGWGAVLGFGLVCARPGRDVDRVPILDWGLIAASIACSGGASSLPAPSPERLPFAEKLDGGKSAKAVATSEEAEA